MKNCAGRGPNRELPFRCALLDTAHDFWSTDGKLNGLWLFVKPVGLMGGVGVDQMVGLWQWIYDLQRKLAKFGGVSRLRLMQRKISLQSQFRALLRNPQRRRWRFPRKKCPLKTGVKTTQNAL
jgi:hypothetical protein